MARAMRAMMRGLPPLKLAGGGIVNPLKPTNFVDQQAKAFAGVQEPSAGIKYSSSQPNQNVGVVAAQSAAASPASTPTISVGATPAPTNPITGNRPAGSFTMPSGPAPAAVDNTSTNPADPNYWRASRNAEVQRRAAAYQPFEIAPLPDAPGPYDAGAARVAARGLGQQAAAPSPQISRGADGYWYTPDGKLVGGFDKFGNYNVEGGQFKTRAEYDAWKGASAATPPVTPTTTRPEPTVPAAQPPVAPGPVSSAIPNRAAELGLPKVSPDALSVDGGQMAGLSVSKNGGSGTEIPYEQPSGAGMPYMPTVADLNAQNDTIKYGLPTGETVGYGGKLDYDVTDSYKRELGRDADASGREFWRSQLAAGKTPEQIQKMMNDTPEGYDYNVGTDKLDGKMFVDRLFRMLGSKPTQGDYDHWQGRLEAGQDPKELANAMRVYARSMGKTVSDDEVDKIMGQGSSFDAAAAMEGAGIYPDLIKTQFARIMGRDPTEYEVARYAQAMKTGKYDPQSIQAHFTQRKAEGWKDGGRVAARGLPALKKPGYSDGGVVMSEADRYIRAPNGIVYDRQTGTATRNGQPLNMDLKSGPGSRRDPGIYGTYGYLGDANDIQSQNQAATDSMMEGRNKDHFNVVKVNVGGGDAGDQWMDTYELKPEIKAKLNGKVQINQLGSGGWMEMKDPSKVEWNDEFGFLTDQDNIEKPDPSANSLNWGKGIMLAIGGAAASGIVGAEAAGEGALQLSGPGAGEFAGYDLGVDAATGLETAGSGLPEYTPFEDGYPSPDSGAPDPYSPDGPGPDTTPPDGSPPSDLPGDSPPYNTPDGSPPVNTAPPPGVDGNTFRELISKYGLRAAQMIVGLASSRGGPPSQSSRVPDNPYLTGNPYTNTSTGTGMAPIQIRAPQVNLAAQYRATTPPSRGRGYADGGRVAGEGLPKKKLNPISGRPVKGSGDKYGGRGTDSHVSSIRGRTFDEDGIEIDEYKDGGKVRLAAGGPSVPMSLEDWYARMTGIADTNDPLLQQMRTEADQWASPQRMEQARTRARESALGQFRAASRGLRMNPNIDPARAAALEAQMQPGAFAASAAAENNATNAMDEARWGKLMDAMGLSNKEADRAAQISTAGGQMATSRANTRDSNNTSYNIANMNDTRLRDFQGEDTRRWDLGFGEGNRRYDQGFGEDARRWDTNFGQRQYEYDTTRGDTRFDRAAQYGLDAARINAGIDTGNRTAASNRNANIGQGLYYGGQLATGLYDYGNRNGWFNWGDYNRGGYVLDDRRGPAHAVEGGMMREESPQEQENLEAGNVKDTIDAKLAPGEFVLNPEAVNIAENPAMAAKMGLDPQIMAQIEELNKKGLAMRAMMARRGLGVRKGRPQFTGMA